MPGVLKSVFSRGSEVLPPTRGKSSPRKFVSLIDAHSAVATRRTQVPSLIEVLHRSRELFVKRSERARQSSPGGRRSRSSSMPGLVEGRGTHPAQMILSNSLMADIEATLICILGSGLIYSAFFLAVPFKSLGRSFSSAPGAPSGPADIE